MPPPDPPEGGLAGDRPLGFRPDEAPPRERDPAERPPLLVPADFLPAVGFARVPEEFAPLVRDAVLPAPADFAAVVRDLEPEAEAFDSPLLLERLADPVDLPVEDLPPALEERPPPDERPLLLRAPDDPEDEPPPELSLDESIGLHLPESTRCAASATASAMIEPSLVALETMLLAARSAVSAASRPASLIFLRAVGLALIAAAAAASPAASISLLIAALASFSTLLSLADEPVDEDLDEDARDDEERDDVEPVEFLPEDFAIASTPCRCRKRHFRAVPVPK